MIAYAASPLTARITEMFAKLLGRPAAELHPDASFLELGADSLLLMQASRNLESTFGVRVPFRQLLEGLSSIGELAAHVAEKAPHLAEEEAAPAPAPAPAPQVMAAPAPAPAPAAPVMVAAPPMAVPAPRPAPVMVPMTAAAAGGMQDIVAQQLALMQEQLELLRGMPRAAAPAAASPAPAAAPAPAAPAAPARAAAPAPAPAPAAASAPAAPGRASTPQPQGVQPAGAHGPHRPISSTVGQGGGFDERQAKHFEALVASYNARTRKSKEYAAQHRVALSDNRTAMNFRLATKELLYPIVGERSQGSKLWDLDGNEYVDFTMGFGVHFFGHRPQFVVDAAEEQLRKGFHIGPQSDMAGPTAELFSELTGLERVTFCNTGSEAIMTAVRIARAVTGRNKIVLFEGSYHGTFDGILARPGAAGPDSRPRPVAPGTPDGMIEDVIVLPYGTPSTLEFIRANASDLAAVLVEPVQTRNPELQPREFLRGLREVTQQSGTAMVWDEMVTGFRLHPGGAQAWYGIQADMATYGKVVGGGFTLGVVAGAAKWMDAIDGGFWSYGDRSFPTADQTFFAGTFCKHPVVMAAAHSVLSHIKQGGMEIYERVHAQTARLVANLRQALAEEQVPIQVLHAASLFQFRLNPQDRWADLLFYHMLERGVYVWEGRACFLSTEHTDEDCDRMVSALRESIAALREGGFLPQNAAS